jgi:hypothetical protein
MEGDLPEQYAKTSKTFHLLLQDPQACKAAKEAFLGDEKNKLTEKYNTLKAEYDSRYVKLADFLTKTPLNIDIQRIKILLDELMIATYIGFVSRQMKDQEKKAKKEKQHQEAMAKKEAAVGPETYSKQLADLHKTVAKLQLQVKSTHKKKKTIKTPKQKNTPSKNGKGVNRKKKTVHSKPGNKNKDGGKRN